MSGLERRSADASEPPTDSADPVEAARQLVLGWGLLAPRTGSVVLDEQQTEAVLGWALRERIDGVLWTVVADGRLETTAEGAERVRDAHTTAQHLTLGCEAVAAEVAAILSNCGIQAWLLKGLAAGHLDYPHPELRSAVDADILVARADLVRATNALVGEGFTRAEPGLATWWEARFARAVVLRSRDGVEVDLHAALAAGYFGTKLDHGRLLALGGDPIDLGGVATQGLAGPARLLSSAYAAVLSRGTRARLHRDLLQQLLVTGCDWEEAARLAAAGDGEPVLALALTQAAGAVGYHGPHAALAWARTVVPSPRAERALQLASAGVESGWPADARSALLALRPADKARFLTGAAFPPAAHRRTRGRSVRQQLGRGLGWLRRPP